MGIQNTEETKNSQRKFNRPNLNTLTFLNPLIEDKSSGIKAQAKLRVGRTGFGPATFCTSSRCPNQARRPAHSDFLSGSSYLVASSNRLCCNIKILASIKLFPCSKRVHILSKSLFQERCFKVRCLIY